METSAAQRIAKNFSWLMAGNTIAGIFNILTVIYIARTLGAANFGKLQFVFAFLLYLYMIIDSGLSTLGTREIARGNNRAGEISINVLALRSVMAVIIYLISAAAVYLSPIGNEMRLLFAVSFLLIFHRALNSDWIFQGLEKMEYMAAAKAAFSLLSFLLIILTVKNSSDLLLVPLAQFASGMLISLIFIYVLFKYVVPLAADDLSLKRWGKAYLLAMPLAASSILMLIYDNLDTIMLGIMDRPEVVGYYNAAYRIFYIFAGVFSVWLATAVPVASKKFAEDIQIAEAFVRKYLRLTLIFIIPASILAFLAARPIILLIFGAEYNPSVAALQVLIWALIPLSISNIFGSLVLIPAGRFNQFLGVVAAGAGLNIILNFLLIPRLSYIGSALATVAAQTVAGIIAFYFSRALFARSANEPN